MLPRFSSGRVNTVCCRVVIKPWRFAAWSLFASYSLLAQNPAWQPSASHTQLPIWPAKAPDVPFGPPANIETAEVEGSVAARPWLDVASPGLRWRFIRLAERIPGGCVIVFPGGGYEDLAIDLVRQGMRARALTATRRLWIHSSVLEASV